MRPWFEKDPARLLRERSEVTQRYPGSVLVRDGDLLSWRVTLNVEGQNYVVRVVYPAAFPHQRIDVFPVDPAWKGKDHQTADGRMCLLSYVPNRWDPSYGAAFMLDRAKGWIELQLGKNRPEHIGEVPFWDGQYPHATYLAHEALQFLREHGGGEFYALEWPERGLRIVTRLVAFDGARAQVGPPKDFIAIIGVPRGSELKGLWVHADESPPWLHKPESVDQAEQFLKQHAERSEAVSRFRGIIKKMRAGRRSKRTLPVIVVHPLGAAEAPPTEEGSAFSVSRMEGQDRLSSSRLLLADFASEIMSRNSGVVDVEALARKTVTVVGLGAIGSVAALALAKAGVRKFHLFDHQKVEPGNVARHVCDLRDIGRTKVNAVGQLIICRNPEAEIVPYEANILSEENIDNLADSMGKSDIVMVSTGDRESSGLVNRLSLDMGVETVYASVLRGARGGEVFRVTPFHTSCFQCVQRYKAADPRWTAVAKYDREKGLAVPRDGCGTVFMPGTGIDTETVALAQARLSLQTLLRTAPGSTYRDEIGDYLLIGNAKGEPFDETYHIIKDDSYRQRVADCEQCAESSKSPDDEDKRLLQRILEEAEKA